MSVIWLPTGLYRRERYSNEAELETAINRVKASLFGEKRIYLDIKRKIGRNIPDGYLIDLTGRKPRLLVVENELADHDEIQHIAVQLLNFSISFENETRTVREVLRQALQTQPKNIAICEDYVRSHQYRNLDHFLDELVHESKFAVLIVIDRIPERLESSLAKKFAFGVEVLELAKYQNEGNDVIYRFNPLLSNVSDVTFSIPHDDSARVQIPVDEIDTIIVPAREEGFLETFVGENRWYSIRIGGLVRPQLRWIAVYRVAPYSAITHIAPIQSIEPWADTDKFVVNFGEPAKEIKPIQKGNRLNKLQNIKYTSYTKLQGAKTLDDL